MLLCFVVLPRPAMDFSQFVGRIGIRGIELKLALEFPRCFRSVLR